MSNTDKSGTALNSQQPSPLIKEGSFFSHIPEQARIDREGGQSFSHGRQALRMLSMKFEGKFAIGE